jgi:stage III sporulation protein AA
LVKGEIRITDDLDKLLYILPPDIADSLRGLKGLPDLIEIVMDLGRRPEARFEDHFTYLKDDFVTLEDLKYVVQRVGKFGDDNRAGIERTLHRISAIRNRTDDIIGLTMRVGRAVYGTISIISDLLQTGKSILLLGRPGVGKTTMLREMARVIADDLRKRVVIVDTSNEIAGDGDIPHPGIGLARRMQVAKHDLQHEVMIEAVQNHMPQVIVVDEIGTEKEAYAARTIAERGVQLIATAHGNSLDNLLLNPTLSDLVGGIQAVTLSDEEAKKRGTQKTVLERKAPPSFDIVIEIIEKDKVAVHDGVDRVVDMILRSVPNQPEIRLRDEEEGYRVLQAASSAAPAALKDKKAGRNGKVGRKEALEQKWGLPPEKKPLPGSKRSVRIFPYAVSRNRIEKAIEMSNLKAEVVRRFEDADVILTLKSQEQKGTKKLREMAGDGVPVYTIRSNTVTQIQNFLREVFQAGNSNGNSGKKEYREYQEYKEDSGVDLEEQEERALDEAERGVQKVLENTEMVALGPQNAYIRRLQHQLIDKYKLRSLSMGKEPFRRVCIYYE